MDAKAKQKALFRAKLNAQKREKQKIDSPLVRYNEHDQPVCRVCDVVVKSESLWPAHQASRKHHEAIENFKANAASQNRPNNAKSESSKELPKPNPQSSRVLNESTESSIALPAHRSSSLPPDFFDNHEKKRPKVERGPQKLEPSSVKDSASVKNQFAEASVPGNGTNLSFTATITHMGDLESQPSKDFRQASKSATGSESKQVKGALPEGFFDDKDAELRARGITPVKPDVKDEYKEFERLIKEDLQEVDDRLEEEEFDTAEMIEEEEMVEQRSCIGRVEMLRRKKLELRASRSAVAAKKTEVTRKDSSHKDSSSDDEDDENIKVDWRAKHL